MKAKESKLDDLLSNVDTKFTVPIFQRKYSWDEEQCHTLWKDLQKLGETSLNSGHFIGSIVCYQLNDIDMPGVIKEKILIDGQQRLTTLSILMIALSRAYEKLGERTAADDIKNRFIFNNRYQGEDRFKLVPTADDKETYFYIAKGLESELIHPSEQLLNNFNYFVDLLPNTVEELNKIYMAIIKLDIVYVVLTKNQDNPQIIFESMNSTGKGLSQGDLLRNYLLLDLDTEVQKNLYESYWRPIEQDFGQQGYVERFDFFLRDYLIMTEKKNNIRLDRAYEEFKNYYEEKDFSKEEIIKRLRKYSKYYSTIYNCKDNDAEINNLWKQLKIQRADTVYPFLMQVYNDYEESQKTHEFELSRKDFIDIVKAIISYVFRRYICEIPSNSLNKTFAILYNSVDKKNYRVSVLATLMLLDSYKVFPNNEDFKRAFATRDMYNTRLKNYILEQLENYNHQNPISIDNIDVSIEHILPETPVLKSWWQEVLGDGWKQKQNENMHRIGNLTLTKPVYNSEMKDYSFKKKLEVSGGIKDSHFILSNWILDYVDNYEKENKKDAEWNIQQINDRSYDLADLAVKIWEYPNLSEEEIKPYKFSNKYEKVSYENIDHLPEMKEKIQKVFDRFDKDIMELDDRITKVITKHYIAYKYDYSNFAEIIVYKNSLNILLDLPIELLKDDKNIAESITVGSWGTGNIRIKVWDDSDYDYKLDLIRQSLENEKNIN